jgi:hypothetical protein
MVDNRTIKQVHQVISALEAFQSKKDNLLSLDKLTQYLEISERELEEVLELVFRFQSLFSSLFEDYLLVKKWKRKKMYLNLKKKSEVRNSDECELKEIEMDKNQADTLSDIVYYFQHVKIGKGINYKSNGTELSKKAKLLNRNHPHFFERRGNGLLYPSKLAIEAGNLMRSYNKNKKSVSKLEIEGVLICIV